MLNDLIGYKISTEFPIGKYIEPILSYLFINCFSGHSRPLFQVRIPVLTLGDYDERLAAFVQRCQSQKKNKADSNLCSDRYNHAVCRDIFQKGNKDELFFFPSINKTCDALSTYLKNKIFFIQGVDKWSFMLAFEPYEGSKEVMLSANTSMFAQDDVYPAGASSSSLFSFSSTCISLLVSEHGNIITNSENQTSIQGMEVCLLQTSAFKRKCVLLKRKEIITSPSSTLIAITNTFKSVKINCFCKQKGFVYSTHLPVLSSGELKDKLTSDKESRRCKYSESSYRHRCVVEEQSFTEAQILILSRLIVFPPCMTFDVPFGSCIGGSLFLSSSEEDKNCLSLVFLPPLLEKEEPRHKRNHKYGKNWNIKSSNPSTHFCALLRPSIFSFPSAHLVQCSPFDYKIIGISLELVSTPRGGVWGVFCSAGKEETSSGSPVPGPSGERMHSDEPCPQPVATVSVPPERQSQQGCTESLVTGPSVIRKHSYRFSGGIVCILPFRPQASSTASVPPERQSQQGGTESPVPGPSGVMHHPYGSFGEIVSPLPLHFQASSTVSVPPERQSQQRHQGGLNSPVQGSSGVSSSYYTSYWRPPFSVVPYHYGFPFSGGPYPYGSSFPPFYQQPYEMQSQLVPSLPLSPSLIRPPVMALEPPSNDAPGPARPRVSVGNVSQTPLWKPCEQLPEVEIAVKESTQHSQEENSDEESDIDVVN